MEFKDAHSYLLRQCIGQDLQLFPRLSRDAASVGGVGNRIISRAYFDSTLAPLLVDHFDANVNLELAYSAAVGNQGRSIDRHPVEHVQPLKLPRPQHPLRENTKLYQENGKIGKGKTTRTVFYPDDHEDDSEPEIEQESVSQRARFIPGTQQVLHTYRQARQWTDEEVGICLKIMRQMVRGKRNKRIRQNQFDLSSERLKSEHNIDRSPGSVLAKWKRDWSYWPEFQKSPRTGDNDDNNEVNKKEGGRQRASSLEQEEEEEDDEEEETEEEEEEEEETEEEEEEEEEEEAGGEDSAHSDTGPRGNPSAKDGETDHEPVDKSPLCTKSRIDQASSARIVTRGMSKFVASDKRTTNNLFQQSRNHSVDAISGFVDADKSSLQFKSTWDQILEHRRKHSMEAPGAEGDLPFPLEDAPDDTATSARPRDQISNVQRFIDSSAAQDIDDEIKKLERFVQSLSNQP